MKVERVSYDVITPAAARGVFDAILWKPAIYWQVKRIEVLAPVKWISVRRNEVGQVALPRSNIDFMLSSFSSRWKNEAKCSIRFPNGLLTLKRPMT